MKSRLFVYKTRRLMRIPASSDPVVVAPPPAPETFYILTEAGDRITTEAGDPIRTEQS